MKITTRLSIQFTFIVAAILILFSGLVYYFSYTSQLNKFRNNLLDRAKNTAVLLIKVSEVDSTLLKKIHQSTISWVDEEIALTDSSHNMIYCNNIKYLTNSKINSNTSEEAVNYFSIEKKDGVRYKYIFNSKTYEVFVLAYDKTRSENLSETLNILFWSIVFSLWVSVLFSYFYSKRALRPITTIIQKVKEINSLKLSTRLNEGAKKDEIEQLAVTFNEMISNLEIAFRSQEDFISNASHELRTPITIMIGESDYLLNHEQSKEVYINHIKELVNDLKKINSLINSLLELAHVNRDSSISFSKVRIDEIIFNAIQQVKSKYTGHRIIPKLKYPEDGNDFIVIGNSGLLEIALKNLIDNACKFSNEDVIVELQINSNSIKITISDNGIGIPANELDEIFTPFRRGSNSRFIGGFGIGLTLVSKIMELHEAKVDVSSIQSKGTRIEILLKK